MAKATRIKVGDKVDIVNNDHYAGHWGTVTRIDVDDNPHTHGGNVYHVSGGSIGDIAPIFERREIRLKKI